MELKDFGMRLAMLREAKCVSARKMSLALGMDANYVNKIERGKAFPSMVALFDICDFLTISQKDFFDEGNRYPDHINELIEDYKELEDKSQSLVSELAKELPRRKKSRR